MLANGRRHLFCVKLIVQAQTTNSVDILQRERSEEESDIGDFIGDTVLSKDIALDNASLLGFADVGHATRKHGISVVRTAVPRKKANKSLRRE